MHLKLFQLDAGEIPSLDRVGSMLQAARAAGADLAYFSEPSPPGYDAGADALRGCAADALEIPGCVGELGRAGSRGFR